MDATTSNCQYQTAPSDGSLSSEIRHSLNLKRKRADIYIVREEVFGIVFDKMRVHLRIVGYFSLPLRLLLLVYFICSVHYLLMILHRALI